MLIKNKLNFLIFDFLFITLFLSTLIFVQQGNTFKILEGIFTFYYFYVLIKELKQEGFIGIYQFYLYTSGLFLYSRIFLDLLGFDNLTHIGFPRTYYFNLETGIVFVEIVFIHVFLINIVYNFVNFDSKNIKKQIKENENLKTCIFYLMIIIFPLVLYKFYIQLMYVQEHGYLSIFIPDGMKSIKYPFYLKGIPTLFEIFFVLLIYYGSKKQLKISFFLYFIFVLSNSLKGQRTFLVAGLLVILFYVNRKLDKKIKVLHLIVLFIFVILFSQILLQFRESKSSNNKIPISKAGIEFIHQQGNSVVVPLYTIENYHLSIYRNTFYIMSPVKQTILNLIKSENGQSRNRLETYNNISDHITYELSPSAYKQGMGVGQSIIADFYDFFKVFGIIIFSIAFAIVIKYFDKNCIKGFNNTIISFYFLNSIIMIPRGYALSIIFYISEILILYFINFVLKKLINKKILIGE